MRTLLLLLMTLCLFACKQSGSAQSAKTQNYNPEAQWLNKMAIDTAMSARLPKEKSLRIAVNLLNEATHIDTTFASAYWNKMGFENELKEYNDALVSGKHLINLSPHNAYFYLTVGFIYEKINDTLSSNKYYNDALLLCNKVLDTMNIQTKRYKNEELVKATCLILIGQEQQGNIILKRLYNETTDTSEKELYVQYMNKDKKELLGEFEGHTTITTIVNPNR